MFGRLAGRMSGKVFQKEYLKSILIYEKEIGIMGQLDGVKVVELDTELQHLHVQEYLLLMVQTLSKLSHLR